jgi:predicted nuclease with RNAse H fold
MRVVGLDLAGKPENPTGFCVLTDSSAETKLLYSDDDIIREVENVRPACVAIDAPFWLPRDGVWRSGELKLLKRGFRPISPVLPTMRLLTMRAIKLVKIFRQKGFQIIEVFSSATESIMGLSKEPRKNKDEYDALLCALTAKAYLQGNYEDLDGIIIPKI